MAPRALRFAWQVSTGIRLEATIRALLDLLFPRSCAGCGNPEPTLLCEPCRARVRWLETGVGCPVCGLPFPSGPSRVCARCLASPPAYARARAVVSYSGRNEERDPVGAAIRSLKYSRRRSLAAPLSDLLADRFPYDPKELDVVVPVPLHVDRLRQRGFNQALLLARGPARRFGLPIEATALERVRPTPPQVGLDEAERRRNLTGAFAPRRPAAIRDRRVLLVDDVMTSSATVEACARILRQAGALRIDVVTVARTLLH